MKKRYGIHDPNQRKYIAQTLRHHGIHPICVAYQQGLYDVPTLVQWASEHADDPLRFTAEVARHIDFFKILNGLRSAGYNPISAAALITDGCRLAGVNVPRDQVERIVHLVYVYLGAAEAGVR